MSVCLVEYGVAGMPASADEISTLAKVDRKGLIEVMAPGFIGAWQVSRSR